MLVERAAEAVPALAVRDEEQILRLFWSEHALERVQTGVGDRAGREARVFVGVVDARGLYARLTTRENIRYYGRLHGLTGAALEKQIDSLLALLDMQSIADRKTDGFSTGEKLKVAIARTLVHDPKNVYSTNPQMDWM